ncbi:MAG: flagellar biosynthesis protein FlhA [Deltaproteobacteria bacterium]|nr:flagellar biosynthesis protein FlhA [Deltaproteobacteria bacterium]
MNGGAGITASQFLTRNRGILVVAGVIGIVFLMIIPLSPFLLDLLLAINIGVSVLIFLLAMYTDRPLDFSVFPSVLLIVTLFRLALNVSSTRLILTRGNVGIEGAGQVIAAFGSFVAGGNTVVGIVIFLILLVINFVVITKGATRIAEVSARFTLDSRPGKQMAIDADLNAGLIDENEARRRRSEVSREADFYGAMDGASKFVRGDAVAGLVITGINILGGLVVGVLQLGIPLARAWDTYSRMTIGDGLVSQMPALVISTGAGILTTRAGSDSNLGDLLPKQLAQTPAALGVASGIMFLLALVPALPFIPFAVLAAGLGATAYSIRQTRETAGRVQAEEARKAAEKAPPPPEGPEEVAQLMQVDLLELEVGYGLLYLVDSAQGGDLLERIRSIRRQIALELGVVVPPIRIRDNLQLRPTEYMILIKGIDVARGELREGYYLAMNPGLGEPGVEGIPTKEPAFGLDALWVREEKREEAQLRGYTVVDLSTVIATHLTEIIKRNAFELLGRQETQNLLDSVKAQAPALVSELVPGVLSLGNVQKVLQNLLRERVSIRDLRTVLETLSDYGAAIKDPELLTEYVRAALRRALTKAYQDADGKLPVLALDHRLEESLSSALQRTEHGSFLALPPQTAQRALQALAKAAEDVTVMNYTPVVLTSPAIRLPLRKLLEKVLPSLVILSHNEVEGPIKTLKVVTLEA